MSGNWQFAASDFSGRCFLSGCTQAVSYPQLYRIHFPREYNGSVHWRFFHGEGMENITENVNNCHCQSNIASFSAEDQLFCMSAVMLYTIFPKRLSALFCISTDGLNSTDYLLRNPRQHHCTPDRRHVPDSFLHILIYLCKWKEKSRLFYSLHIHRRTEYMYVTGISL